MDSERISNLSNTTQILAGILLVFMSVLWNPYVVVLLPLALVTLWA